MFDIIAIPFGFLLKLIYNFLGSYGLSLIVFTILSKVIIYPFTLKSKVSMRQTQKIQPQLKEIQKRYANNKQKLQEETAKIYKDANINPMGSCLPMLITLPIMLGLYYVIQQPMTYMMGVSTEVIEQIAGMAGIEYTSQSARLLETSIAHYVAENYSAVASLSDKLMVIDFNFFGFNLAETPSFSNPSILLVIPVLSGLTAFLSMTITQKLQGIDTSEQQGMMKGMTYTMPFMSAYFALILPAGLGLYWITGNILMIVQEYIMQKHVDKVEAEETAKENAIKELEIENRRKEIEFKKEEQRRIALDNSEKNKK